MVRGLTEGNMPRAWVAAAVDDGSIAARSMGSTVSMAGAHATAQSEPQHPILS